jgi:hypothetical protein
MSWLSDSKQPEPSSVIDRAVELGTRLLAVEAALEGARIGYGNSHFNLPGYTRFNYSDLPIVKMLNDEREIIRAELWQLGSN